LPIAVNETRLVTAGQADLVEVYAETVVRQAGRSSAWPATATLSLEPVPTEQISTTTRSRSNK
jgi:hypothetical protein